MNDQHPFDVTPADDDRRPVADATQQTSHHGAFDQYGADHYAAQAAPATAVLDEEEHARTKRKHRRIAALSIAAAVIFTAGAGGGAAASLALARSTTAASANGSTTQQQTNPGTGTQGGFGSQGGVGGSGSNSGSGSATDSGSSTAATNSQIAGLVVIDTVLGYENGEAAGTGIILTSSGRILTNNHVIDGATSIKVTVASTGKTYTADVVGTNATKDIAVLQLENASGLTTADLASSQPSVGDAVTAVGNANGTGTLSQASGTVSALGQTITTSSEGTTAGETLNGLIEIDADVVSGDSGGAVENSSGDVVGVTTAASSGTSNVTGYAIPITTALSIAKQIVAGDDTSEITIGLPAFLGVEISTQSSSSTGAVVGGVLSGTAAAKTDLAENDVITKVDGTTISSGSDLSKVISSHKPGDSVTITYTDTAGSSHTATVTLTEGPAD